MNPSVETSGCASSSCQEAGCTAVSRIGLPKVRRPRSGFASRGGFVLRGGWLSKRFNSKDVIRL